MDIEGSLQPHGRDKGIGLRGICSLRSRAGYFSEVIRIFRSAQSDGEVYILPRVENPALVTDNNYFVLSKVGLCFRLLLGLMLDARTVRFIRKAIPDIIAVQEEAYFCCPLLVRNGAETPLIPSQLNCEEKKSVLSAMVSLVVWSDQARSILSSRTDFLNRILQNCMAGTNFSNEIIDHVIGLFWHLARSCDLARYFDDMVGVLFKSMEVTEYVEVLRLTVKLLEDLSTKHEVQNRLKEKLLRQKDENDTEYLIPLLAMAACPNLMPEMKPLVYSLLFFLNESVFDILLSGHPASFTPDQERKLEMLLAPYPKALARRQQLSQMFDTYNQAVSKQTGVEAGATPPTYFEKPVEDLPDKVHVLLQKDIRPRRNCSALGCSKMESQPCQFKLCGGCRHAVYCSQGIVSHLSFESKRLS
jgi:hypothetical protein